MLLGSLQAQLGAHCNRGAGFQPTAGTSCVSKLKKRWPCTVGAKRPLGGAQMSGDERRSSKSAVSPSDPSRMMTTSAMSWHLVQRSRPETGDKPVHSCKLGLLPGVSIFNVQRWKPHERVKVAMLLPMNQQGPEGSVEAMAIFAWFGWVLQLKVSVGSSHILPYPEIPQLATLTDSCCHGLHHILAC